jgi:hypothetical protein
MADLNKTILVKSSSGDSYAMEFILGETNVRVFCHCAAGTLQQMCKHKLAIIKGDAKMLFDESQGPDLSQILAWPSFVKVQQRLALYESQISALEKEKSLIAKKEKDAKHAFARELTFGI